ncbi:MAG TPA: peptidyl-prolyl cis-trans isomerase [Thermoleophilaceae bacterium]|nr:peptidyl-prolyl cis-trans isomerase [Thermoleophilaceae bacterium]
MTKKLLSVLALPTIAAALLVAGCGSGVPSNSVATVDGTPIKKTDFNHWLAVAARQSVPPGSTAKPAIPDPPNYTNCVATLQKQPVPKGQNKPSAAALKAQCEQQYNGLKTQVMEFLIQSQWLLKEADARNLTAKPAQVQQQLNDQIKQSFPKRADFNKFLKTSGMTMNDLLFRVKVDVLTQQVRQKVVAGQDKVSDAAVAAYYNKNKARFAQPERRDLLVVLTKTQAKANQAKAAIQSGQSWASVAKKFSIDQASKSQGGKLPGVAKGQQEKSFDTAIFSAKKNQLEGPVKTQFGYYVFKVTKVTPASQQTEKQAHDTIVNLLRSQQEQTAINNFVKDYQKKYKSKTNCAKGYVIDSCKNAPKPKKGSTGATGAQGTTGG